MTKFAICSWLTATVLSLAAVPAIAASRFGPRDFGIERFLVEYREAVPRLAEQFDNYQLTIEQSFYWGDGSTQVREKLFAIKGDRMMIRSLTKTDFVYADQNDYSEKEYFSVAVETPGDCFRLSREKDSPRLQVLKLTKAKLSGCGVLAQAYIVNAPFNVLELRSRIEHGQSWLDGDDWSGISATSREVDGTELVRVDWMHTEANGKHYDGWWVLDRGHGWRLVECGAKLPEHGTENIIEVTYQEIDGRPVPKSLRDFVRFTADGSTKDYQREVVTAVTFDVPEEVFDLNHYGSFGQQENKP